jgi:uncharacterized membrane protein
MPESTQKIGKSAPLHPFRRAVLRGLAVVLPPLLTIVVFLWAWNLIYGYVLRPVENVTAAVVINWNWNDYVRTEVPGIGETNDFQKLSTGEWVNREIYEAVNEDPGKIRPHTAQEYCYRWVRIQYLKPWIVIPTFLVVFVGILYTVGRSLAAGMGRWTWVTFEAMIRRLPIIRNVYSSVKQVTDFIFSEQTIEFNRVVAVEYPRRGMWSIGFVTGESMLDIESAANEPVLSVLMPTSPMPMTGFTITVRKSETVDLNISVDQAIQFVVSCGVVVPANQLPRKDRPDRLSSDLFAQSEVPKTSAMTGSSSGSGTGREEQSQTGRSAEAARDSMETPHDD